MYFCLQYVYLAPLVQKGTIQIVYEILIVIFCIEEETWCWII